MIKNMWKWPIVALLLIFSLNTSAAVVVIVSAKSSVVSMSQGQVASLFLGKSTALPGGGSAQMFDLPESSPVREQFYQSVAGKSASQVKAVWSRLVFSGKALPPKELSSDAEVKKAVASDLLGIGYINATSIDATVKTVLTLP